MPTFPREPGFQAQLLRNNFPIWEATALNYSALLAQLLVQLEDERQGTLGWIRDVPSQVIVFRCRKVAPE